MVIDGRERADGSWSPVLGGRLKLRRVQARLSRAEMAAELEVSQESVRRWEQGGSKPSPALIEAYLRVVGSDVQPADQPRAPEADPPRTSAIGLEIRARRSLLGLTQWQAAKAIGVAQPTLAGWEIGRSTPGRDHAPAIASFLEVPLHDVEVALRPSRSVDTSRWPLFGRIIGERRLSMNFDRVELAARLHVSARTVAAWETGEKVPNNSHLARLAELLEIAPAVLVSALPEKSPASELGKLIHRRQRLLGLDRDDIALACDVTPVTVGRWIWGRNAPTEQSVVLLAAALELDERIVRTAIEVDDRHRVTPS